VRSLVAGIDFDRVRAGITIEQVLDLLGCAPTKRSGAQRYRRCLRRGCGSVRRGSFSVNVALGRYSCHRCRGQGNALELDAATTNAPLHQAAVDLCQRRGRDAPWIRCW